MNKFVIIIYYINLIAILSANQILAGPPFITDDPEPVELHHFEFYLSSADLFSPDHISGTLPHFEVNYGAFQNTQLHLIVPINFDYNKADNFKFSYSTTELGIKYRFVEETDNFPQIGTFPIFQLPLSLNMKESQLFLPVWFQKSFDKFSTYGGFGYGINPGVGNRNWLFLGMQCQYEFSEILSQGFEVFYHSGQTIDETSQLTINYGGFINSVRNFHFLYSIGHSVTGNESLICYLGLLFTI